MSQTSTFTRTSTYTESRARYILGKVYEDCLSMVFADLVSKAEAERWRNDLLFMLSKEALDSFEIQLVSPTGSRVGGYRYQLDDAGSIYSDDDSGGSDFYGLNPGTKANLFVTLRTTSTRYREVVNELITNRGWGSNGVSLQGDSTYDRGYSSSGYGLNRNKIGSW
ncbi:hypothetical protein BN8_p06824 (plasmid) [Fibrisoma limi BUZ 3]|uniref:Bacterial HORMA domain-containing protein n=1 Tax=Fibrisoma limi BUZ 3 TaxID=1185876 RepID=I2GU27_9BACT|nr:hypothetical protein [Fibrisoma limi]CCH57628.1 hypothetical protein BN8_p06824 [Fibrisoma limi BUZ 3]